MLNSLTIRYPARTSGIRGFLNRFRRDVIDVEIVSARGVALRRVTYTSFSGEVRLERLREAFDFDCGSIICSDRIIFPHHSGFERFNSDAFSARLCTNLALKALSKKEGPQDVRLGIYDPEGAASDFVLAALRYCREPVVVSDNTLAYSIAANRALEELGASVRVERDPGALSECGLIIAPVRLTKPLRAFENAVVLCVGAPDISGNIYGKYSFRTPNGFDKLKPRELSEEYFCSALYSLASQHELGSIVPLSVSNSRGSQTASSIAELI